MKMILAIETSCDETAAALIGEDLSVISNEVASQIATHKEFGGVVPEVASRLHVENIYRVIDIVMEGHSWAEVEAIAVTYGPGLLGALMIGLTQAKMLALLQQKPLLAVNHMEGHIWANFLVHEKKYPFITLIVSGGHSQVVLVKEFGDYEILSKTVDDAAGEAFDKVARVIGLGYPGGPIIDKKAKEGNPKAILFPRAVLKDGSDNFSFSGIKTAVIDYCRKNPDFQVADVSASFQQAVVDTLVSKTIKLSLAKGVKDIYLAGGVAANSCLRKDFEEKASENGLNLFYPPLEFCTDNGAMIGAVAWEQFRAKQFASLDIKASPSLKM